MFVRLKKWDCTRFPGVTVQAEKSEAKWYRARIEFNGVTLTLVPLMATRAAKADTAASELAHTLTQDQLLVHIHEAQDRVTLNLKNAHRAIAVGTKSANALQRLAIAVGRMFDAGAQR